LQQAKLADFPMNAEHAIPTETVLDIVTPSLIERFCATVGGAVPTAGPAPLGIHWCLGTPVASMDRLGPDGHPKTGGFMPLIAEPRRMWAASTVEFLAPIPVGSRIKRESMVRDVTLKTGSSGPLTFVTVAHETCADDRPCIRESQTLVFKSAGAVPIALPSEHGFSGNDADVTQTIVPDPPLLFRYSALTFNTHRIHYDQSYASDVEGYPALVVHGPLIASMLLRLASAHLGPDTIRTFAFRAHSPAFCGQALHLGLKTGEGQHALTAHGGDGRLVLSATIS
jgi:3-methylfumaryl-CoA hydratase